jgi:hypothetical protein
MHSIRLLAVLSLALAPACLTTRDVHYFYPTPIASTGAQLFLWPAPGGEDRFRAIVQPFERSLADGEDEARTLSVTQDAAALADLVRGVSVVTALLPRDAELGVRSAAIDALARIARARPDVSTHCVTIGTDARLLTQSDDLDRVLAREAAFQERSRPLGSFRGVTGALGMLWTMQAQPNFAVVPLASAPDSFAVLGNMRDQNEAATVTVCRQAEVLALLRPRLLDAHTRGLEGEWGSVDRGGRTTITTTSQGSAFVALLMPRDAPAERRVQCDQLARQLCDVDLAPIAVAQADTNWTWSECTSADFVKFKMPTDGDWSFVVGPVRQTAMLAQPPARRAE